jgi:hypothetical protein
LKSAHATRHLSDELNSVTAELNAVSGAQLQVERAFDANQRHLGTLIRRLTTISLKASSPWPLVKPQPIESCFAMIWDAAGAPDDDVFLRILCGCADQATLDGLAAITGSPHPMLDAIAKRIAFGACYRRPPIAWGGKVRSDSGWLVHVLPPLDGPLFKALQDEVAKLDPQIHLATCATCVAGVNVVGLVMRHAKSIESDLFPRPLQLSLIKALQSDCVDLFFPEGLGPLKQLGIALDDGRLTFSSPKHS